MEKLLQQIVVMTWQNSKSIFIFSFFFFSFLLVSKIRHMGELDEKEHTGLCK